MIEPTNVTFDRTNYQAKAMSKENHGVPWHIWTFVMLLSAFVTAATPVFLERILNKQIQIPFLSADVSTKDRSIDREISPSPSPIANFTSSPTPDPSPSPTPDSTNSNKSIEDSVRAGETKSYKYKANQAQVIILNLKEGADSISMAVFDPDGKPAYGEPNGNTLKIRTTRSGEYEIVATNAKESISQFKIDVEIE